MPEETHETPVSEIMSSPVVTVAGETTIAEAAGVLADQHIGSLVVGEDIIEGIVTETDIVRAVGDDLDLDTTPVADLMSDPVVTIRPHESVQVAGERMGHNGVKKLPVTENGEPVGIVTTTDLAHFFPRNRIKMASQPEQDVQEGEFE
jgi:CBS domain-containing protein